MTPPRRCLQRPAASQVPPSSSPRPAGNATRAAGLRAGKRPTPPTTAASSTNTPKPHHSRGTALKPAAPGKARAPSRRTRPTSTGPSARQNGGHSSRLYQGSWVCSGSTNRLAIAVRPSTHRPQRLRRWRQARAMPNGHRGSQGQPPLITSSSGGQGPPPWPSIPWPSLATPWLVHISSACSAPLTQPCQPCQASPGSRPKASASSSQRQSRPRKSRSSQRSSRAVANTGKATGALSNSRALVASPASRPPRSSLDTEPWASNSPHHSRAIELRSVPSSITKRPWRARGSSVRATRALARAGAGPCWGSRRRCTKANSGTRADDSRAGPNRSNASGGKAGAAAPPNWRQRRISRAISPCRPGGLLR